MKKWIKVLALSSSLFLLAGCGCSPDNQEVKPNDDTTENLKYFDDVRFENAKFEFDGMPHTISPVGLPADTVVTYVGENSFVDVGVYTVTIQLKKPGYQTKTMSAELEITLPLIKGLSIIEKKTITYDGNDHIADIKIEGQLPEDAKVLGPIVKFNNKEVKEAINAGKYSFHFKVTKEGYEPLHLYSELVIEGKEFVGVTLSGSDKEIPYDGTDHINDFSVVKPLNPNASVEKVVYDSLLGVKVQEVIECGEYLFEFIVKEPNFKDKILERKLVIFDGKSIVNTTNKIVNYEVKNPDGEKVNKLIFMDLHNYGKVSKLDSKDAEAEFLIDEPAISYSIANETIFYKNDKGVIKYKKIGEQTAVEFPDQKANMDFISVQGKHLLYTRNNKEASNIEICVLLPDSKPAVIYSGLGISNLISNQNKVYFLENSGLLSNTIKEFSLIDTNPVTPVVLNKAISNVVNFKICGTELYFSSYSLLNKYISSYPLFGSDKVVKQLVTTTGENIEFDVHGNELYYKTKILIGSETEGIYKHLLDNKATDVLLFDTKANNLNINSLTYFEDRLYFSNQSPRDCHLYSIPSFGKTEKATLVK